MMLPHGSTKSGDRRRCYLCGVCLHDATITLHMRAPLDERTSLKEWETRMDAMARV
jgi:hypothetical protein